MEDLLVTLLWGELVVGIPRVRAAVVRDDDELRAEPRDATHCRLASLASAAASTSSLSRM